MSLIALKNDSKLLIELWAKVAIIWHPSILGQMLVIFKTSVAKPKTIRASTVGWFICNYSHCMLQTQQATLKGLHNDTIKKIARYEKLADKLQNPI